MSQKLKIADLKPHERNSDLFDDITGDAWTEFVDSIRTSGVIEPIVVTQDKVIVSGHQRVRACKILDIDEIDAEVKIYDTDDEILKCLIDTNIRQRGIGNPNPVKFRRCIEELERIAGITRGGDRKSKAQNELLIPTQEELANSYGISLSQWKRYKEIGNYIPEIQDLLETKIVTPSVARAIVKKLPEDQQKELAKQFAEKEKKVTGKEAEEAIQKLIGQIHQKDMEIEQLKNASSKPSTREMFEKNRADRLQANVDELKERIRELESAEPETVEVYPEDYEESKEELWNLKCQLKSGAKSELYAFMSKYQDAFDVVRLIKDFLSEIDS